MAPSSIRMENFRQSFRNRQLDHGGFFAKAFADHLSLRFLKRELECRQFLPGCVGIGHIVCEASVGGGITSSHAVSKGKGRVSAGGRKASFALLRALCGIRPCLTSGPTFVTLRPWKRTLSACDSRSTPRTAKSDFLLGRFLASEEDTNEEAVAFDTRSWLWPSVGHGI